MGRTIGIESIESKIEKAQVDVVRTKQKYDAAVAKLGDLMDKRDAFKKDELVKAVMKSDKTYEEILTFLNENMSEDE